MKPFCSVPDAIEHIRHGNTLIITDHTERENEGDFFFPALLSTPERVNFVITHGKGILCVAITEKKAKQLDLPPMVPREKNNEKTGVNFAVSVNAKRETTSGVSAFDRAKTIRLLADESATPDDFTRPGHVFPLIAHEGGILARDGHTEAAVTLARLAGLPAAGVLCEIIGADGHMANLSALTTLSESFGLKILSIEDLIAYVKKTK